MANKNQTNQEVWTPTTKTQHETVVPSKRTDPISISNDSQTQHGGPFFKTDLPSDKEFRVTRYVEGANFEKVNFSDFPDDYFMINDISLDDIPVTQMGTNSTDSVFVAETLRSKSPIVVPNGRGGIVLNLTLFFNVGKPQIKLQRLISQLRNNPLVYIYNNKIREDFEIPHEDNAIFILEHGSLRNAQDAVGGVVLDLMFHYFNYKPF